MKIRLCFCSIVILLLASCVSYIPSDDISVNGEMTYYEARPILYSLLVINKDAKQFEFFLDNSKYDFPEEYIDLFYNEVLELNKKIQSDINDGYAVTLYDGKSIFSYNMIDGNSVELVSNNSGLRHGGSLHYSSINNGWAFPWKCEFSSRVNRIEGVISMQGTNGSYWYISVVCNTGKNTANGRKEHTLYGTHYVSGIRSYWVHQDAPQNKSSYEWNFIINTHGNDQSYGSVEFIVP